MRVGDILLLCLLGVNACYDLRKREIHLLSVAVFGILRIWILLLSGKGWEELLWSILPGILLLAVSLRTHGKVGMGDAWILMVTGLQMGFFPVLMICWGASLLILGWFLAFAVWSEKKNNSGMELPMVPFFFLAAVAIWLYRICRFYR